MSSTSDKVKGLANGALGRAKQAAVTPVKPSTLLNGRGLRWSYASYVIF
jgi:hypothetical protein